MAEGGLDLALDLVAAEQRNRIGVELDLVGVVGHHLLDEGLGLLVRLLAVDEHLADVAAQVVADGADDDVVFLIDQGRRLFLGLGLLDGFPELQQVVQIPLQFLGAAADARGADDHPHALGDLQLTQGLPQFLTVVALDAPGNAPGARIVGHEHQVTAGQADERGERRPLGAAFFLVHLHQHLLAFGDDVLDHGSAAAVLRLLLAGEILAGDFLQRQKAVTLRAEVDEGRFQARLHPGDPGLVDARFLLLALAVLDVQVVELLPVYQGDTHLFGLRGVDQHSFHTSNPSVRAPGGARCYGGRNEARPEPRSGRPAVENQSSAGGGTDTARSGPVRRWARGLVEAHVRVRRGGMGHRGKYCRPRVDFSRSIAGSRAAVPSGRGSCSPQRVAPLRSTCSTCLVCRPIQVLLRPPWPVAAIRWLPPPCSRRRLRRFCLTRWRR